MDNGTVRRRAYRIPWAFAQCEREIYVQRVPKETDHISRPSNGDCCGTESVFKNEIPTDDPGDEFTERAVAVGVCRTRDRHCCRELRITESGEGTHDTREYHRDDNGRTGVF